MISLIIVDSFAALFFSFSLANRVVSLVVIELPVAIASLASCEAALRFVITLHLVRKCSLLIISLKCNHWARSWGDIPLSPAALHFRSF